MLSQISEREREEEDLLAVTHEVVFLAVTLEVLFLAVTMRIFDQV
jgi:hypothetical protein